MCRCLFLALTLALLPPSRYTNLTPFLGLLRKLSWNGEWSDWAEKRPKKEGVAKLIETSRSNVLGDAIRNHLSVLYEVDRVGTSGGSVLVRRNPT